MKPKVSRCIYYDSSVVKMVNYGVLSTAIWSCTPAHDANFYGVFFDQTSVIDVPRFSILNDAHANCTSNLMTDHESYLASMFNIATSYTIYA